MHTKNRLKKLEKVINVLDDVCRCDNPLTKIFPRGDPDEKDYSPQQCFNCRKLLRRPIRDVLGESRVILPDAFFTRAEFSEWQDNHVKSAHQTYEEFLHDRRLDNE